MTIREAANQRHTVRKFTNKKIPTELLSLLNDKIQQINKQHNLELLLVTNNSDGLSNIAKLILSKGVKNYFILVGKPSFDLEEKLGYFGTELMLYSQTLGLNTWWISGTYNSRNVKKYFQSDDIVIKGIIAVGYGQTPGVLHKSKSTDEIANYDGTPPQ